MENSEQNNDLTDVEMATDRLWSWKFELNDWVGMSVFTAVFLANAVFLFRDNGDSPPINGMILSAPWFYVLLISVFLIIKPMGNSTRIPAVFLILLSALAIAVNTSFANSLPAH